MKIAIITEHFFPYTGGIAEHTFYLAQNLARQHQVYVLAPLYPSVKYVPLPQRPEFKIMRMGKAGFFPANGSLVAFTYTPGAIKKLMDLLINENFDVVHIQGSVVPTLPFISSLIRLNALKVVTFHAYHGKSIGYTIFRPILRKALAGIDGFIAVSNPARHTILNHFNVQPISVIPNGVDTEIFSPVGKKFERFDDGKFNVLFVGRLEKRKGLPILIRALSKINNLKMRLLVVGTGPMFNKYRQQSRLIPFETHFLGKLSTSSLSRIYRTSDVFVAPSIKGESFGIVLLEAMASMVPVIASDIPGYRETLHNGKYGILFQNKDPQNLRDKIMYTYQNYNTLKHKTELAYAHVRTNFTWERVSELTLKFYKSLSVPDKAKSHTQKPSTPNFSPSRF